MGACACGMQRAETQRMIQQSTREFQRERQRERETLRVPSVDTIPIDHTVPTPVAYRTRVRTYEIRCVELWTRTSRSGGRETLRDVSALTRASQLKVKHRVTRRDEAGGRERHRSPPTRETRERVRRQRPTYVIRSPDQTHHSQTQSRGRDSSCDVRGRLMGVGRLSSRDTHNA